MSALPSKSFIDKLGERLKNGDESDETLGMLSEYRARFDPIADELIPRIEVIAGPVNRRVGKTTMAIVAKLRRIYKSSSPIRLSQIQDIAGARVVVENIAEQNALLSTLREVFPDAKFVDKRHATGTYRAVHVVIKHNGLPFELQIRTKMQHDWAQISEDLAAGYGSDLKYGHGPDKLQKSLVLLSNTSFDLEEEEIPSPSTNRTWDLHLAAFRAALKKMLEEIRADEQGKHTS